MTDLGRLDVKRRSGDEPFRDGQEPLGFDVLSFWRWSASDLMSNATRGVLAEYLVARATGASPDGVRDEWATHDLTTPGGVKIEVKSSAYIQTWQQARLSTISFSTRKTLSSDADTGTQGTVAARHADVYVFALLAHQEQPSVDPLDLHQWEFFVVPTAVLDARTRSQHSITLPSLRGLAQPVDFHGLAAAVASAAAEHERLRRAGPMS